MGGPEFGPESGQGCARSEFGGEAAEHGRLDGSRGAEGKLCGAVAIAPSSCVSGGRGGVSGGGGSAALSRPNQAKPKTRPRMSIHVVPAQNNQYHTQPHLLPCEIQYNGPTHAARYFKPKTTKNKLKNATFRGRNLIGKQIKLPHTFIGCILQDTLAHSLSDQEKRTWVNRGSFDELTYWKHDEAPNDSDPLAQCMNFARMACVLHDSYIDEND